MKLPQKSYEGLSVTFQVTQDCNLRCKYCYEIGKKPGDLPLEYAQKFIELLINDPDPILVKDTNLDWVLNQGLILDFIGGDALMRPKLCDEIIQYFQYYAGINNHRWAYRWRASISSNGTLFDNSEVRDFLEKYKNNLSLGISLDGCPEIHDKNRVFPDGSGSFQKILEWWPWYKKWSGNQVLSTKATCNKDSIPYLFASVKFLHEKMDIQDIFMNFSFEEESFTEKDYRIFAEQLDQIVEYLLKHQKDLYFSMLRKSSTMEPMPAGPTNYFDGSWCGAGAMPTLSIDGKIYPCFRFAPITLKEGVPLFSVGDIWQGFNHKEIYQKIRSYTRKKITPETCFNCGAETNCAWCIGGAYAQKGKFLRQVSLCRIQQLCDKYARIYWNKYNEQNQLPARYPEIIYPQQPKPITI